MRKPVTVAWAMALAFLLVARAEARIKLVALPQREAVSVRLDNPAFTLVEEERFLTLQKGNNHVDFSWKGVNIDPDSIRLEMLDHPQDVRLISVSYPPNEAALVWQLSSAQAFTERVRVSYLLSNIDRLVTYEGLVPVDESSMELKSYLVLRNFSGEDFSGARVNLDYGEALQTSIRNQETKRMLFFSKPKVAVEKTLVWDDQKQPWDPEKLKKNVGIPVFYTLRNTREGGLGENALWGGKARIFQEDGRGSTIFLGEDMVEIVPVGEKLRLYIGDSRDVVVTQRKMKEEKKVKERNNSGNPILWDSEEILEAKIENFREKPATLLLIEHIPGQWDMISCTHKYELRDSQTLEFLLELKPKDKVTLTMHYNRRNLR
ncbi:MAG: hypothetical protein WHX93_10710 [bacterium]